MSDPAAGPSPAPVKPARSSRWAAPLFLAALSMALYWPALDYPFVYDDWFLIQNHQTVRAAVDDYGAAFDLFRQEYWEGVNPNQSEIMRTIGQALYRPLTVFTWATIAAANGVSETWPYHLASMLVNAAVVVLLYRLVLVLFGRARLAFVAALIFALHPLHTEAVAYIAGLSDLLSAAAVLGGVLLFERATRDPAKLAAGPWVALLAVLFVGLLAKEQGAVLIGAVAITDAALAARGRRLAASTRFAVYGGLLAMLVLHLVVRQAAIGSLEPDRELISRLDNPLIEEGFGIRLMNGLKLLAMQVWLFLWPAKLSIDYSFDSIPVVRRLGHPAVLSGALLIGSMLAFGLLRMRRRPALCWGLLLFLGAAFLTSNIAVPIGTIFGERLMYLSSAGLCVAVAAAVDGLVRDRSGRGAGLSAAGMLGVLAVGGALGLRTWERNEVYAAPVTLFEAALDVVPNSARVHYQLGFAYAQQGLHTKAEEHFARALAIDGRLAQAAIGLADTYAASRNWDKAITAYDRIIHQFETTPTLAPFKDVLATLYGQRGKAHRGKGDLAAAQADLQRAASTAPGAAAAHAELARLHIAQGQPGAAVVELRTATQIAPQDANLLYELARAAALDRDTEAYEQALAGLDALPAGQTVAKVMRAEVLFEQAVAERDAAKRQEALDVFRAASDERPDLSTPYLFRGRFLLDTGRYYDAIGQFDSALERAPGNPVALLYKARAQNLADRPRDALATAYELERMRPDADCHAVLFEAHLRLGDLDAMAADAAKLRELEVDPHELVVDRAIALRDAGRLDEAIQAVESGRMLPGSAQDSILLHNLALLLISARRYDEALHALDMQAVAEQIEQVTDAEPGSDPFRHINRFRALFGQKRYAEAAAELDLFEQSVDPTTPAWASLLHRRSELLLEPGTPYYDPQRAAELCAEGAVATRHRYPDMYDRWIEALVATGDLAGAAERAREASGHFPGQRRFQIAAAALQRALAGEREVALDALRKPRDEALARLAQKLEAHGA